VILVIQDQEVLLDHRVFKDLKEKLDLQDHREHVDFKEIRVSRVTLEVQALLERQGQKDQLAQLDTKETRVTQAYRVYKEIQVLEVLREKQAL
jgi:hypothetical protein